MPFGDLFNSHVFEALLFVDALKQSLIYFVLHSLLDWYLGGIRIVIVEGGVEIELICKMFGTSQRRSPRLDSVLKALFFLEIHAVNSENTTLTGSVGF